MAAVAEVTKENFAEQTGEGTVLIDVWGPQCAPCLALNPHVEKLAESHPEIKVLKLEAPKNRRLCMELRLLGLPVFLLFRDGDEVSRLSDPDLTPARLDTWLDETLAAASS